MKRNFLYRPTDDTQPRKPFSNGEPGEWDSLWFKLSSPPGFTFGHVLLEPVFIDLESQPRPFRKFHDTFAHSGFFVGGHLLFESAEGAQRIFDLEEILDCAG